MIGRLRPLAIALGVGIVGLAVASADPPARLPDEVRTFLDRRAACDHWRGEEAYDEERGKDIAWSICQACVGTDADLARLRRVHAANPAVMAALAPLEAQIELPDKAAAREACRQTRKPAWVP